MRAYEYALSLTSQFYFCGVPFRLDTSPKCAINCLYCFAMTRGGRRTSRSLLADATQLRMRFERLASAPNDAAGINDELLANGVPLHFGGMSDPFSTATTSRVSEELLRILAAHDIPTILSTKNTDALTSNQTLRIIEGMRTVAIQISISAATDASAALIEPTAPSTSKRLAAVRLLTQLGKRIIIRLQPLIPWLMREVTEELIPALADYGARHVIVEFLKLPVEKRISRMGAFFRATSWDGYESYRARGAKLIGREWLLPTEYKWAALQPLVAAIRSSGMTFGAADYGLNHLGDTDCCCGIDDLPGFSGWFQGNLSQVIKAAAPGCITVHEMSKYWYPAGSIKRVMNSNSRKADGSAIRDYLLEKWNSPGTTNAPDSYLGVSWEGDRDGEGNCIYRKEKVL